MSVLVFLGEKMKFSNIKTALVVLFSFAVIFVLFNLDNGGQISAFFAEYFPTKDAVLSLSVIAFLVYSIIKGIHIRNGQSLETQKETKIWYVLLLMICTFTLVVLVLSFLF